MYAVYSVNSAFSYFYLIVIYFRAVVTGALTKLHRKTAIMTD